MTSDVPYKHPDTGVERNFPDGLGEKLGYERIQGFTPPELGEPASDAQSQTPGRESEVDHSVSILLGTLANGFDTLSPREQDLIEQLARELSDQNIIFSFGKPEPVEGEPQSAPSVAEVIAELETRMDADEKISKTGREAIGRHIKAVMGSLYPSDDVLTEQVPYVPPTGEVSTTNPKESDLPGKSSGQTSNPAA